MYVERANSPMNGWLGELMYTLFWSSGYLYNHTIKSQHLGPGEIVQWGWAPEIHSVSSLFIPYVTSDPLGVIPKYKDPGVSLEYHWVCSQNKAKLMATSNNISDKTDIILFHY